MDEVTNDVPEMVPVAEPAAPEVVVEAPAEPVVEPEIVPEAPVEPTPEPVVEPEPAAPVSPEPTPEPEVVAEPVAAAPGRADMGKVFERNGIKFVRTTDAQGNVVDIALPTAPKA